MMAGIYIHIPFCRKACHFCNFHFSTSLKQKERMLHALLKEIEIRNDELPESKVNSIYLGGGTPSVLDEKELDLLFSKLKKHFSLTENAEITLETNPDDLNDAFLKILQFSPVNRLSIGLQSLDQGQLEWMNRSHSAQQCYKSLERAMSFGFQNITVDWLYGYPGLSTQQLEMQLNWMRDHNIPHFSAYALTVEPNTVLAHRIENGKEPKWDEELSSRHFDFLMDWAKDNAYDHYEISNFAKEGYRAIHNTGYWHNTPYLGIGPSAHSYIGNRRQWNIANNIKYMKSLESGKLNYDSEELTIEDKYNEWVMTNLRLKEGLDLKVLENYYSEFQEHFESMISHPEIEPLIMKNKKFVTLNRRGKHFADRIAAAFFV